jgi:hypothetical protein
MSWSAWRALPLSLAFLGPTAAALPAPLSLHPENPRYFLFRGKPTLLVTSGEHYGAVLNRAFDYSRYLETLAADGLNHTRTFSGVYREVPGSFGITDNTLAPTPGHYLAPWARSDQPGESDGGNRFDLERWDEAYFTRLRELLGEASRRGVVVELNLFCPFYEESMWAASPMNARNNANGIGAVPRQEVYTLRHPELTRIQEAVTRKIVSELNGFDNLYYEVANEPYFGGITQEWQDHVAAVIAETEKGLPHRHLVSMNIANGRARVESPNPLVSIFNFHYATPPDVVAMNAHLRGVIGENETGFRGKDDVLYRTEGWAFLLAGGGLYNNLDYSFTPAFPDGTFLDYASPGGGSPTLRRQLGMLKRFLERFDFVRMAPDPAVLAETPKGLLGFALAEPGRQYAVYLHEPVGGRGFAARWTGTLTPKEAGEHTFTMVSDDGVRLWVDGRLLLENWTDHAPTEDRARIELRPDRPVEIRLEYYQGSGGAEARLRWTRPDGTQEIVPAACLRPSQGTGPGLRGEYFDERTFEGEPQLVRTDPVVDFVWEAGTSPLPPPAPRDGAAMITLTLPAGRYQAEWLDPRNGNVTLMASFDHDGGARTLEAPPIGEDIALALRAEAR